MNAGLLSTSAIRRGCFFEHSQTLFPLCCPLVFSHATSRLTPPSPAHAPPEIKKAALTGNVGCIDLLIQEWADVEAVQSNGDTPLYSAVCGRNLGVVLALLKHGADANTQNWRGESPIFYAATYAGMKGAADVVDALLRWGADPLAVSSDGKTAADVVAERLGEKDRLEADVERVRELLERA